MRSTPESAPIKQRGNFFLRRVIFVFFGEKIFFFYTGDGKSFSFQIHEFDVFMAIVCFDLQRNHQSLTCQNHNVDPETFESPRSERLGSLKIAIVQKSFGGKYHQRYRKHCAIICSHCFILFTLFTLFTILKLLTLLTLFM